MFAAIGSGFGVSLLEFTLHEKSTSLANDVLEDKMAESWKQLHSDPRMSYYLFLRRNYRYSATQALKQVKQTDAMIMGIQLDGLQAGSLVSATAFGDMLQRVRSGLRTVKAWLKYHDHQEGWSRRRDDVFAG